uniref:N-acetyltransferase domain-containing protein n=1 Tax=Platysiphonia delicata TaxID=2006979 RepID=A0A1Z1M0S8_9FLOR|nr:hypothetical protein [Platysiphonia delicata]ARW59490.1 hypothetical protein [Platysiphonia delicata]
MTFWKSFFQENKKNNTKNIFHNDIIIEKKNILIIEKLKSGDKIFDIYLNINSNINLHDLEKLCNSVGWVKRPIKKVKIALNNSFLNASLFYYHNNNKKLIGFARVTSDQSFNATIWDVVIDPKFQKMGLGSILINQVIKELRYYDISTITLFADPDVVPFYQHLGFIVDPDGVKGMFWYPL